MEILSFTCSVSEDLKKSLKLGLWGALGRGSCAAAGAGNSVGMQQFAFQLICC